MLVTIGRDFACNFVVDSPRVSGFHCQIRFFADRFEVTDLGSSNGTFVGMERTRVQGPTTVYPGQPLYLGSIEVSPREVAEQFGLQWPGGVAIGSAPFRAGSPAPTLLDDASATQQQAAGAARERAAAVERVEMLRRQRRFPEAIRELDTFMSRARIENDIDLLMLRVRIFAAADMASDACETLFKMRWIEPSLSRDVGFLEELAAAQFRSCQFSASLRTIDELEALAGYNVPIYLQLKAQVLIGAGRVHEGEQVVQQLARVDPTNRLVQERAQYLKVGNNYVGKSDAVAGGCAVCAILELVFDCL